MQQACGGGEGTDSLGLKLRAGLTRVKITILGGGPAGLYFALLMKRDRPDDAVTVIERNRADDTFGFGVVFSDETLENFARADPASFRAITDNFAWWDDIEIRFRGTVHRVGGNGFCGCSRRSLLMLLQARCRVLGVELRFRTEFGALDDYADSDLIVAADGLNSRVRDSHAEHFQPSTDLRPNRFAWMGSTKPLDAFTFSFRETPHGVFIAHAYQYEPGASTWVLETDADTFSRAGLDDMDEAAAARLMELVFADDLSGHRLLTNRSVWRRFPMIRNRRWTMGKIVLLGDAKATAHFSIGSGTKLAMEDAIALHACFREERGVTEALARFEIGRRADVEKTQHAADVSLVWFEHLRRFWDMDPVRFAFGLMTRSKSITYDNLRLRAPEFVDAVDRAFAADVGLPSPIREGEPRRLCSPSRIGRGPGGGQTPRRRRCSSRSRCATCRSPTAPWSRRCACTRRMTACRPTSIWCITAPARWAAPG